MAASKDLAWLTTDRVIASTSTSETSGSFTTDCAFWSVACILRISSAKACWLLGVLSLKSSALAVFTCSAKAAIAVSNGDLSAWSTKISAKLVERLTKSCTC